MSAATVGILYWVALMSCAVTGVFGLVYRAAARDQAQTRAPWLAVETVLALLVVGLWIARWSAAGHIPLFGTYESAISLAVAAVVTTWLWHLRTRVATIAGPVAALIAAAVLAHGLRYDDSIYALTISEKSWVVDIHAYFAWAAFGVLTVNAGWSLRVLLARAPLPPAQQRLVPRTLELGFVLHTGMMVTGSFYKFLLFGNAWSFDPIESMGLIAWLAYGTLVHMVRFARWRDRRLAAWCLFLFVILVVSYRFIIYFPAWSTYHIFDINLRIHLTG